MGALPQIDDLDVGIRRYVEILRQAGIETFESCDGSPGHSFPEPTVRFHGEYGDGFRAYSVARANALPVTALRRVYAEEDGELKGPWWELVFSAPTTGSSTCTGYVYPRDRVRKEYLEKMAAAYLKETSLSPGRACLCEQTKDGVTRWWFEEREEPSDGD